MQDSGYGPSAEEIVRQQQLARANRRWEEVQRSINEGRTGGLDFMFLLRSALQNELPGFESGPGRNSRVTMDDVRRADPAEMERRMGVPNFVGGLPFHHRFARRPAAPRPVRPRRETE